MYLKRKIIELIIEKASWIECFSFFNSPVFFLQYFSICEAKFAAHYSLPHALCFVVLCEKLNLKV